MTLKLTSKVTNGNIVDNAPEGPSPGDVVVFTEDLRDASGTKVGDDAAVCTRLFGDAMLCTGLYRLPGGHVSVQLYQPGATGTYQQAVTGGTGRFAGARGTVTVAQSSNRRPLHVRAAPTRAMRRCENATAAST